MKTVRSALFVSDDLYKSCCNVLYSHNDICLLSFSMAEVKELGADVSSFTEEKSAIVKDTATKTTTTTTKTLPLDSQASGLTSSEKRLRALKKKLQQIEALKEKRDCGEVLEKTQVRSVSNGWQNQSNEIWLITRNANNAIGPLHKCVT